MIRVEGIKTFEELLAKHGKGYGCEVCKPTVGSLLASCWNEYILKPEHTPLQDSNDNFPREHPERRHLLGDPAFSGR